MIEEFMQALKDDVLSDILDEFNAVIVETDYEPGGRWSEWIITTIKLGDKFYKIEQEIPASETQEGMELSTTIYEVEPYQTVTTAYKKVGNDIASWYDD